MDVPGQKVSFWSLQMTQPQNESSNWDICISISRNITRNKITIAEMKGLLGVINGKLKKVEVIWGQPADFTNEIIFLISLSGSIIITVESLQEFQFDADLWLANNLFQSASI